MTTRAVLLLLALLMVRPTIAQAPANDDEAQKWGMRQMSHMLADRPVMKTYIIGEQIHWVTREDTLWQWVAEHYAGKATGFHAAWHEAPPTGQGDAMHAYGKDKVYIYVAPPAASAKLSHNQTFEKLWSSVVFELLNMEGAQGFSDVTTEAAAGRCTREEYILKYAEVEHQTCGRQQAFFRMMWLPWCQTTGFRTDPEVWSRGYHPDFKTWIRQYPRDSWYPWACYGEYYDQIRQEASAAGADTSKKKVR